MGSRIRGTAGGLAMAICLLAAGLPSTPVQAKYASFVVDADSGEGPNVLIEVIAAEHENLGIGPLATEPPGQVDARGSRHPDVEDHDGGSGLPHDLGRLVGIRGFPDDSEASMPGQPAPDTLT